MQNERLSADARSFQKDLFGVFRKLSAALQ
jgi:hypothetical protein